eukprot:scaffold310_cov168-Amphora_coffeaeformis.AAC.57
MIPTIDSSCSLHSSLFCPTSTIAVPVSFLSSVFVPCRAVPTSFHFFATIFFCLSTFRRLYSVTCRVQQWCRRSFAGYTQRVALYHESGS